MSRSKWLLCLTVGMGMLVWMFACGYQASPQGTGGLCTYTDTPGQATVVSVTSAPSGSSNCSNDPVEVRFNFTPTDPAKSNSLTDNNRTVIVGNGLNPPRAYITAKGFTVGSTHSCVRRDIATGACSPLIFEFPTTDFSDYGTACF